MDAPKTSTSFTDADTVGWAKPFPNIQHSVSKTGLEFDGYGNSIYLEKRCGTGEYLQYLTPLHKTSFTDAHNSPGLHSGRVL